MILLDKPEAGRICSQLLNTPKAPGVYSHFINVGTDAVLDALEKNYFQSALKEEISCFKYLEGRYGAGKTQFINCLAERAWRHQIVTSIVSVGNECPFNSPLAIYRAVVSSFVPPPERGKEYQTRKGVEILVESWIKKKLGDSGWTEGQEVPLRLRSDIEKTFTEIQYGSRDMQAEAGIRALGKCMLGSLSGGAPSQSDSEIVYWVRGDKIQSATLRRAYGLHEAVTDQNAFNRLKTLVSFLRNQMGYRGFLIAFDEGTRTASFRRGSTKQKQAIENMLTMINENAEGEFSGVMFLYAATPDFRSDVITKYTALNDRIGSASFSPGRPMVPYISLDSLNTDDIIVSIGERLLEVFAIGQDIRWDYEVQKDNLREVARAEKKGDWNVLPRTFIYHYCMLLSLQKEKQRRIDESEAENLVEKNALPLEENI